MTQPTQTTQLIPAFGYLRVSGNGQLDGDGFPRQQAAIQSFAERRGYTIVRWFEEKAIPGTTEWTMRPAWQEMIRSLNGTKTIMVEKLDRLARDLMVQEHIIADLRRRTIDLVSVATGEETLCIDDPGRKLMRQIMGSIHEYERAMITAKLEAARKRKRARGERCEGVKPFGMKEGEALWLDVMREQRKGKMTFEQIAASLNERGAPTRMGGKWIGAAVCKILRREGL